MDEPAHSSPAVKSSESPGRKKPISSPVSAKSARKTPSAPRLASSEVELSGLSATAECKPARCNIARFSFMGPVSAGMPARPDYPALM